VSDTESSYRTDPPPDPGINLIHVSPGVAFDFVVGVAEEDVLGLEVSVGQTQVVKEAHGVAQLVGHVTHLVKGVGVVVVLLMVDYTIRRVGNLE
jgi:hypothetical protein